jgi:tetratricopeptide (TPR) repeat protein
MAFLPALAALAVYAGTLNHAFVAYDDGAYVYENPTVTSGLSWHGLWWALTTFHAANWHPLTWLSHMLDASLFGSWAGGHHLSGVLIHAAAAALLYLAFERLLGCRLPSLLVALLFAVHPLNVQSVAWVAERKDVLSGLLMALVLLAWSAYLRDPGPRRLGAVAGLFALGLLAKPMLVTLPCLLLLLDFWPLGRLGAGGRLGFGRAVAEKTPLLVLSTASALVTVAAQRSGEAISSLTSLSVEERVANAAVSLWWYLGKAAWPSRLAIFYPHPRSGLDALPIAALAALAGVSAAAFLGRRRMPWLVTGWLWYLGMMIPVIGLVQVGSQGRADRYGYLPLLGIFLAAAWGILGGGRRRAAALLAFLVVLPLAAAARHQVGFWRDGETLFRRGIEVVPGSTLAYLNLGKEYEASGEGGRALEVYRRAIEVDPGDPVLQHAAAALLLRQGRLPEAAAYFREVVRLAPDHALARFSLGLIGMREGRWGEAAAEFEAATRFDPRFADAWLQLGTARYQAGDRPGAADAFREATRHVPGDARAHFNLGVVLAELGRGGEARRHFEQAASLDSALAVPPP